jgi:hypothetical protein
MTSMLKFKEQFFFLAITSGHWRHFRWKGPTWGFAKLPVAHAHNILPVPDIVTSHVICGCSSLFHRVVVQVHSYRRSGRVCAISPLWGLLTGSWLQEVTSFSPRIFLSGSTTCWLVVFSTTFASTPFPGYLSFYFVLRNFRLRMRITYFRFQT